MKKRVKKTSSSFVDIFGSLKPGELPQGVTEVATTFTTPTLSGDGEPIVLVFIEAHWAGREGAPILTKPKRVVGRPRQEGA